MVFLDDRVIQRVNQRVEFRGSDGVGESVATCGNAANYLIGTQVKDRKGQFITSRLSRFATGNTQSDNGRHNFKLE